jgi:hypothetical protein
MTSFAVKSSGMSSSKLMNSQPATTSYFNPMFSQESNENASNNNNNNNNNTINGSISSNNNRHFLKALENSSNQNQQQTLNNAKLTQLNTNNELQDGESYQMAKNKFSGSDIANRPMTTIMKSKAGTNSINPLPSGITRIYINNVSSSNNVSEKIKDANLKSSQSKSTENNGSLINLNQYVQIQETGARKNDSNNLQEVIRKDNSTSPIKIYASRSDGSSKNESEMKTNYSDFNLMAPPRTQG